MRLCIIDEDNVVVSCMTIPHSSQPSSIITPRVPAACVLDDVFPNPTSGNLNLRFCESYTPTPSDRYCILDVAGRSFHPFRTFNGKAIDTNHLSSGNYLLLYDHADGIQTIKFTVVE